MTSEVPDNWKQSGEQEVSDSIPKPVTQPVEFVSLMTGFQPAADTGGQRELSRFGFPDCNVSDEAAGNRTDQMNTPAEKNRDASNENDGADNQIAQNQAAPPPRPGRPPDRPAMPWERESNHLAPDPKKHSIELDKELSKKLDPKVAGQIDKLVEGLGSSSFAERQQASQELGKLLDKGDTPTLARCVKAFTEAKDPETSNRLRDLIGPHASRELLTPSFGQWVGQQGTEGSEGPKGLPAILKELDKKPAEQADRQKKLEVLSTFLSASNPYMAKEMNVRLGEYTYLKEIANDLKGRKSLELSAVTDADLSLMSKLAPNLHRLEISKSPDLSEKGLSCLKEFGQLETLALKGLPITEMGMAEIASVPNLKDLSVSLGKLTDDKLKALNRATNLENLNLTDNPQLTDASLAHLKGLQNLQGLTLDRTGITDKFLEKMPILPNLSILSVKGTKVGADAFDPQKLKDVCPDLSLLIVGDHIPEDKLEQLQQRLDPSGGNGIHVTRYSSYG